MNKASVARNRNEVARLSALYNLNILDTPPEERFDRLTRLAANTLGMPIALVSLSDRERQWFKSHFGLDVPEIPRELAPCVLAIQHNDTLIIEDTLQDSRFAENPLVTGAPYIRFYAGQPLQVKEGFNVGTLCVIDHQPRHLTETQITILKDLAQVVQAELDSVELVQIVKKQAEAERQLQESEQRFKMMADSAPVFILLHGIDGGNTFVNKGWQDFTGCSQQEAYGKGYISSYHPDDWKQFQPILTESYETRKDFETEVRLRRYDGVYRWMLCRGVPRYTTNDEFVGFICTCIDIHDRKISEEILALSEERFAKFFNLTPLPITINDLETGVYLAVNATTFENSGITSAQVLGRTPSETGWMTEEAYQKLRELIIENGSINNFEITVFSPTGEVGVGLISSEIIDIEGRPAVLSVFQDITELKKIEEIRRLNEERLKTILNASPLKMSIRDLKEGRFVTANETLLRDRDVTLDEIIGKTTAELGWSAQEQHELMLNLVQKNGSVVNMETIAKYPSGKVAYGLASAETLEIDGQLCYLSVFLDITKQKEYETVLVQREREFKALVENSPDMVVRFDRELRLTYANPALERVLGYPPQKFLGHSFRDLDLPELLISEWETRSRRIFESQQEEVFEFRTNNTNEYYHTRVVPEFSADGQVESVLAISHEITDYKLAVKALSESEAKFRTIAESSPVAIAIFRNNLNLYQNQAFLTISGYTEQELANINYVNLVREDYREIIRSRFQARMFGDDVPTKYEYPIITKNGETRWILANAGTLEYAGQKAGFATMIDITERKFADDALRESEARFRVITETIQAAVFIFNEDKFFYANPGAARMMGYSVEELVSMTYANLTTPEFAETLHERARARYRGENMPTSYEMPFITKQGELRNGFLSIGELEYEGEITILATIIDITNLKLVEDALRESETKFRVIADTMPAGLFIATPTQFLYANKAATVLTGYSREELSKLTLASLVPPEERELLMSRQLAKLKGEEVSSRYEHRMLTKSGEIRWVFTNISTLEYQGQAAILEINIDITETKQTEEALRHTEEQLRQSQKMEAVGRLAGGIAHDFNNLLTGISGFSSLIRMGLQDNDPIAADIDEIIKASNRAANLTAQLLAFSRKTILQPKELNLNELVRNLERLLQRVIGEDIELITHLRPQLGIIRVDPNQLEQVIMNLVVNAREAMPKGGTISIETSNANIDATYATQYVGMQAGEYVLLTIRDTGAGIAPEIVERIFEPFFTTKEVGKGTGLGLSTVYGIIKQSGGSIWVDSTPGQGTSFRVYLPRLTQTEQYEQEGQLHALNSPPSRQRGIILLVEDEEMVRRLSKRLLTREGYQVVEAKSGMEALDLLREKGLKPNLMITDIVMPRMNGTELAQEVGKILPGLKILFMTGYSDTSINEKGVLAESVNLLQKPFTSEILIKRVNDLLQEN